MVWLLAGVYFLIKPTRYLILSWSRCTSTNGLAPDGDSGVLGSMFDLAGPVGTLAGGYLSDRLFKSKRMPMAVIALFCLAIVMAAFRYLPPTRFAVGMGFFVIGFLIYIPTHWSPARPQSTLAPRKARPRPAASSTAAAPLARYSASRCRAGRTKLSARGAISGIPSFFG